MAIGASEAETFWTGFLRSLARRGLRGVQLVISDDHKGLKAGATRCARRRNVSVPRWTLSRTPGRRTSSQSLHEDNEPGSCYATPRIHPSTLATLRSGGVRFGSRNPATLPSRLARDSQAAME